MKKHLHAPLQPMSSGQLFTSEMVHIDLVAPFQCPIYKYAFCELIFFQLLSYCALSVRTCWNSAKALVSMFF